MQLLDDAIERIKPAVVEAFRTGEFNRDKDNTYRGPEDYGYFGHDETTATVARIRLDWELSDDGLPNGTPEDFADLMFLFLKPDLEDLIVDGDTSQNNYALLKAIDGSKKRGKEPVLIDIFRVSIYREIIPKKKSTEYSVFILMAIKWEE